MIRDNRPPTSYEKLVISAGITMYTLTAFQTLNKYLNRMGLQISVSTIELKSATEGVEDAI